MTGLFFEAALLPAGWARDVRITIRDGRIEAVEAGVARAPGDAAHGTALPGLPNLHSHAFQRGMAGLTERRGRGADSFWSWRDLMYRFVAAMTPEQMEAIAAQAYAEMLEGGFTRVGEFHYLHHGVDGRPYADIAELAGRIVAAAGRTGIGLTLLPVLYAHAGFGGQSPDSGQARFINDVDRFHRLLDACRGHARHDGRIVVGVAPHSLRAVTPEQLAAAVQMAQDGPIHIHIAEQTREVDDCLAWCGQRPVAWLLDHAPVDAQWCLVHATHMNAGEIRAAAASGAVAGLCPVTEANLGDGIFAGAAFLAAGGAFGVGSDSNVLIGAADELRQLEYSQRLDRRARNVLSVDAGISTECISPVGASTGRTLFDAALSGGARALGASGRGLAAGAEADIVALRTGDIALAGREGDAVLDSWIFAAARPLVDQVWAGGRHVVRDGHHVDGQMIARNYRRAMAELSGA